MFSIHVSVAEIHVANSFESRMLNRLAYAMISFQTNEAWSCAPGLA
jgi:hypothetical protein